MNQPESNASLTSKITQSLAKGCGCMSIFFFVFFIWGIWTTYTTYSSIVELRATIDSYIEIENVDLNARLTKQYFPVVSYEYKNEVYQDTLDFKASEYQEYLEGSLISIYIHPENPQFAIDSSKDTFYFYAIFLVLATVFYVISKILKNPQQQFFSKNN
jgi:hypothetical protein